jgi:hypothetical protein
MPAKFDPPIYLNSSNNNNEVIVFGKSPEQEAEDIQNGVARLGGAWRQPSYAKAYLRAARVLIRDAQEKQDLDQLAMPIFYLQRHSLELFIKGFLGSLYDIARMRFDLQQSVQTKKDLPSKNAVKRLTMSHDLQKLNSDLREISVQLQIEGYPNALPQLIKDIETHENNPTWSRYPCSGVDGINHHLKAEVVLPLVDLHQRLEKIIQDAAFDVDQGTETLEASIYYEMNSLLQSLDAKIPD